MYLVSKQYTTDDMTLRIGEIVTGKGYRLLGKLIKLGYLKECDTSRTLKSCDCELCKRKFVNKETLEKHYLMIHPDEVEIVE